MATVWQQLGAWVVESGNVDYNRMKDFYDCGGRWVAPILYNDDSSGPRNRADLPRFKRDATKAGLRVAFWANCFGENPDVLVSDIASYAEEQKIGPILLDCEFAYKDITGNAEKLPILLKKMRARMPAKSIGVTSFGFCDRAMIWNGRTLVPMQSFYDLKIRFLPQWYYVYDGKYAADASMEDLMLYGATDANIRDLTAPGGRGVPLPYVHGAIEVTGVEQSSLALGIEQIKAAKQFGFTRGFSVYTLDSMPPEDFGLLAAERGKLFYL
jgi:hypothetical protein